MVTAPAARKGSSGRMTQRPAKRLTNPRRNSPTSTATRYLLLRKEMTLSIISLRLDVVVTQRESEHEQNDPSEPNNHERIHQRLIANRTLRRCVLRTNRFTSRHNRTPLPAVFGPHRHGLQPVN